MKGFSLRAAIAGLASLFGASSGSSFNVKATNSAPPPSGFIPPRCIDENPEFGKSSSGSKRRKKRRKSNRYPLAELEDNWLRQHNRMVAYAIEMREKHGYITTLVAKAMQILGAIPNGWRANGDIIEVSEQYHRARCEAKLLVPSDTHQSITPV